MDYIRDEHRVHLIMYHLVWTFFRRKKLTADPAIARDYDRLVRAKCEELGLKVAELAVQPDHIHLFVQAFPTHCAADIVKNVKGYTSHELRKQYPELCKIPTMHTRSYFAATVGNVSKTTIARYIANQKGF